MVKFLSNERALSAILFLIVVAVYATTVCPTVTYVDNGELAAVVLELGIAHPTGYPLFTFTTRVAYMIVHEVLDVFTDPRPITILNHLSAVIVGVAVVLFSLLFNRLRHFGSLFKFAPVRSDPRQNSIFWTVAAFSSAIVLAFGTTFWMQATSLEVYSLHLLLMMLILLEFFRGLNELIEQPSILSPHFLLAAFLIGLGFANHMSVLMLAPALLTLFFVHKGFNRESVKILLYSAPLFVIGVSTYLYLPVRMAADPPLQWGSPSDLERIWWHVSAKQFSVWIFSAPDVISKQWNKYIDGFGGEYHFLFWFFIVAGVVQAWRSSRLFLLTIVLFIVGCLLLSVNYDIVDIESYFLLSYVGIAIFLGLGFHSVLEILFRKRLFKPLTTIVVVLLIGIVQVYSNHSRVDQSGHTLVEEYSLNILRNAEPNAVFFSYQWDYFISAAYYLQLIEGIRPDVTIIDKELFRRSWYFKQLERNSPQVITHSRPYIDLFLKELYKFEHDLPYDPNIIEFRFNQMVNQMIDTAISARPVYLGFEMEPHFAPAERYSRVADGLFYRAVPKGKIVAIRDLDLRFSALTFESAYTENLRTMAARMLSLTAVLQRNQGRIDQSMKTINAVLTIHPSFSPALTIRREIMEKIQ